MINFARLHEVYDIISIIYYIWWRSAALNSPLDSWKTGSLNPADNDNQAPYWLTVLTGSEIPISYIYLKDYVDVDVSNQENVAPVYFQSLSLD